MLVILWGLPTTFFDIAPFISQSLVSYFQEQVDYTSCKDSSQKFSEHLYFRWTFLLSPKTFSVLIYIF